jgi:hypothetical protein
MLMEYKVASALVAVEESFLQEPAAKAKKTMIAGKLKNFKNKMLVKEIFCCKVDMRKQNGCYRKNCEYYMIATYINFEIFAGTTP